MILSPLSLISVCVCAYKIPNNINYKVHSQGLTSSQILPFLQLFGNLKLPLSPPNGRGITGFSLRSYPPFDVLGPLNYYLISLFPILILFASEVSRWISCSFVFWSNSPLFLLVSFIIGLFFHVGFLYLPLWILFSFSLLGFVYCGLF